MLNLTITFRSGKHETLNGVTKIECKYETFKKPEAILGGMFSFTDIKLNGNTFAIFKDGEDKPYGFYNGDAIESLKIENIPESN